MGEFRFTEKYAKMYGDEAPVVEVITAPVAAPEPVAEVKVEPATAPVVEAKPAPAPAPEVKAEQPAPAPAPEKKK